jgi:hypothetical protein
MMRKMIRALLLVACMPVLCFAQGTALKRFAVGPVDFEADREGIVVYYHGHDWRPDVSKIPIRGEDCSDLLARKECSAHPGAHCLACIEEWLPVAWDGLNEILYVAASREGKDGHRGIVLGYDLRSDQMYRIVDGYRGGLEAKGEVASSGGLIAVLNREPCDPCCSSSHIEIIDTQLRRLRTIELPTASVNETVRITGIRWTGSAVLEYSGEVRSDCRAGVSTLVRKTGGSLDIPELLKLMPGPDLPSTGLHK